MKILLLTYNSRSYKTKRLCEEAKKRNHSIDVFLCKNILFNFHENKNDIKILTEKLNDILGYDFVLTTSPSVSSSSVEKKFVFDRLSRLYEHFGILADFLNKKGGMLNGDVFSRIPHYTKFSQHYYFIKNKLPVISSSLYTGEQINRKLYKKFSLPFIVKASQGGLGKNVYKINNLKNIPELIKKYGRGSLIIQKYIPIKKDYRVLVLGNKILGGIQRTAPPNSFKTNISLGGIAKKANLTVEMKSLALKATKIFHADFTGIDLIQDVDGKYYILEINFFPGIQGFEKATKINVAEEIIKFAEKKVKYGVLKK